MTPLSSLCSSTDPRQACTGRHEAGVRGEFCWTLAGWTWPARPTFAPTYWMRCPWCRVRLPGRKAVEQRILDALSEPDEPSEIAGELTS